MRLMCSLGSKNCSQSIPDRLLCDIDEVIETPLLDAFIMVTTRPTCPGLQTAELLFCIRASENACSRPAWIHYLILSSFFHEPVPCTITSLHHNCFLPCPSCLPMSCCSLRVHYSRISTFAPHKHAQFLRNTENDLACPPA